MAIFSMLEYRYVVLVADLPQKGHVVGTKIESEKAAKNCAVRSDDEGEPALPREKHANGRMLESKNLFNNTIDMQRMQHQYASRCL